MTGRGNTEDSVVRAGAEAASEEAHGALAEIYKSAEQALSGHGDPTLKSLWEMMPY